MLLHAPASSFPNVSKSVEQLSPLQIGPYLNAKQIPVSIPSLEKISLTSIVYLLLAKQLFNSSDFGRVAQTIQPPAPAVLPP